MQSASRSTGPPGVIGSGSHPVRDFINTATHLFQIRLGALEGRWELSRTLAGGERERTPGRSRRRKAVGGTKQNCPLPTAFCLLPFLPGVRFAHPCQSDKGHSIDPGGAADFVVELPGRLADHLVDSCAELPGSLPPPAPSSQRLLVSIVPPPFPAGARRSTAAGSGTGSSPASGRFGTPCRAES